MQYRGQSALPRAGPEISPEAPPEAGKKNAIRIHLHSRSGSLLTAQGKHFTRANASFA